MATKNIKHYFDLDTWVKIESVAAEEGKSPESVAVFILSGGVGLIPSNK